MKLDFTCLDPSDPSSGLYLDYVLLFFSEPYALNKIQGHLRWWVGAEGSL